MNGEQTVDRLLTRLGIPTAEAAQLAAVSRTCEFSPGESFIAAGQIPVKFAFVIRGLFRYLYIDSEGNEFTKGLIAENNFLASYSAMIDSRPSPFFIQTLEPAQVLEIDYRSWLKLRPTSRFWDELLIRQLEKGFRVKENRERELLLNDAHERYRNFLEAFPGLENRVSQQIIASYLGIKPESLSRIRKKMQLT